MPTQTETVEPSELYQRLLATRPPRQGAVEWNEGRNRTVNVPFKSYWAVTDTTDEIQTAEVRTCACMHTCMRGWRWLDE
jgi:hypothetical protein